MIFSAELNKLGLSEPEAKILSCLLQFGDASATDLAQKTKLGRTNVYDYAKALIRKNLVSEYERRSKIYFRAENPNQLKELAGQRLREAKEINLSLGEILPKMEEYYSTNLSKPLISFFTGKSGYQQVFDQVYLEYGGSELLILIEDLDSYLLPEPKYRNSLFKKQIHTNLIANKGKIYSEFKLRDQKELRSTYLVAASIMPIKLDMILLQEQIFFGDINPDSFAVTSIKSSKMAIMLKSMALRIIEQ